MKSFVKSILFAGLGVCCLTLASDARQAPPPATAPATVTTLTTAPGQVVPGFPLPTATVAGQPLGGTLYRATASAFFEPSDGQAAQLAKQIKDAKSDDDKEKLKGKLKEVLVKQFDDRQKRHEQEIAALETQIKKLKEMVAKRSESKKEIIEDRTRQLDREANGLGW